MSEQEIRDMKELDKLAEEAGGFVADIGNNNTHYDYRKIIDYCKEKGIEPIDMTIRELNRFIIQPA